MRLLKIYSVLILLLTSFTITVSAQNHVKWTAVVEDTKGDEAIVKIIADVEKGWHIYTQFPCDECFFLGTLISFEDPKGYTTIGKTSEPKTEKFIDENGDIWIQFIKSPVIFEQKIKKSSSGEINIYVEYQSCNDVKCVQEFSNISVPFTHSSNGSAISNPITDPFELPENTFTTPTEVIETDLTPIKYQIYTEKIENNKYELTLTGNIEKDWSIEVTKENSKNIFNYTSDNVEVISTTFENELGDSSLLIEENFVIKQVIQSSDSLISMNVNLSAIYNDNNYTSTNTESINLNKSLSKLKETEESRRSYFTIFILAFLSGFAALLTPCVFPMIPMTVSFFTKQSKTKAKGIRNAIVYGLSIIVIYVGLGLLVTMIFGASALNALSTNVWFNIFFFLLLFIFGMSFLGAFEISLPTSWINKADKKADKGGFIGIFFMAFTLALVSFSCTGPIIGTLLVEAASQGGLSPFIGMFGFSLALALPFALFAAFPGWLNSLPQSGGWLNTVKVVLGLLEIAFSFKFLSNADLVVQAHLLEREVFLAIWIAIFIFLTAYLLGKIQLPHDSKLEVIKVPRFLTAMLVFSFVIYLIPGLWGAPLKLISGFPPPINYSESPFGIGGTAPDNEEALPEGAHYGPHGLVLFNDLESGQAYANEIGLPVMLDFTGLACVNCRRMEENVWSAEKVIDYLRNDVVIVSLHVDDKAALPESEQTTSEDGAKIRTIGNKWSYLQRSVYGSQSQPQYFILDNNGERMGGSASYESHGEAQLFENWLKENLSNYNVRKDLPFTTPTFQSMTY